MILWVVFAQVMLLIAVNLLHIIFFFWWPGTLQGLKSLDPTLKIKSLIEWRTEAVRFFRKLSSNKKYWCIWSLKGSLYLITDPRGSTHCFQTSNTENRFWKHLMAFELHDQQTQLYACFYEITQSFVCQTLRVPRIMFIFERNVAVTFLNDIMSGVCPGYALNSS